MTGEPRAIHCPSCSRSGEQQVEFSGLSLDTLRRVIDCLFPFVGVFSLDGRLIEANRAPLDAAGVRRADVIGKPFWETYWWSHSPAVQDRVRDALQRAARGEIVRYDEDVRIAGGSLMTIDVMFRPLRGPDGEIEQLVGCAVDVTGRKQVEEQLRRSLEEKDALLTEIHHRVKNNLQMISSLVHLQARTSQDPPLAVALAETRDRIRTMALVHERLYGSGDLANIDLSIYLRDVVDGIAAACRQRSSGLSIAVDIDDVIVGVDQALPCGLIVSELVTNAMRHAFVDHEAGHVQVTLRGGQGGRCVLTVADDGAGMPSDDELAAKQTLGLDLVRLLCRQLGGEFARAGPRSSSFGVTFYCAVGRITAP